MTFSELYDAEHMTQNVLNKTSNTMNKLCVILAMIFCSIQAHPQQAYFVDGYHGGIYGHYPV